MSVESTIYTVLHGDATLLALATGGVWSYEQTGEKGINRTLTPTAFDEFMVIKPCVLVSARAANPGYNIQDDSEQVVDVRQVIETYIMADSGYAAIDSIAARCFTLLQAKQLTGIMRCEWAGSVNLGRDIDLNANIVRHDWLCVYLRSGS